MTAEHSDPVAPIRTALFIDFDNIYGSLREVSESSANKFARNPRQWMKWLQEGGHEIYSSENEQISPRNILIRRCYLNPARFGKERAVFSLNGFSVIDCPSLTARGKNSADIYMVMDIMDTLNHRTLFEEFIILSSDADFTPVLLRLREYDRRSMIISNAVTASALKAASDFVVELDQFIEEAVEGREEHLRQAVLERLPPTSAEAQLSPPRHSSARISSPHTQAAQIRKSPIDSVLEYIREYVGNSPRPVPLSTLGLRINGDLGQEIRKNEWQGYGTLSNLIKALEPSAPFKLFTSGSTRLVYQPGLHELPTSDDAQPFEGVSQELIDFIDQMNKSMALPRLPPKVFRIIFDVIGEQCRNGTIDHLTLLDNVIKKCLERKLRVNREDINFILTGLGQSVTDLKTLKAADIVARTFHAYARDLCRNAQIALDEEERKLFWQWLVGSENDDSKEIGAHGSTYASRVASVARSH